MATRTSPLVSAATLASVAAIAVATPAIMPSMNTLSPHALAAAKVQLTTMTDVLSIPAAVWTDILFSNTSWGGTLGPDTYGPEFAQPQDVFLQGGYVNPWASACDNRCTNSGISGVGYLFLDALVNGDGKGYANSDDWSIGLVNYLFEPNSVFILGGGSSPYLQYVSEGWSAAAWYILQGTLGNAIPDLTVPIAAAFWGPTNVSVFYNLGLTVVALGLANVPVVGGVAANSILAYLGDLQTPESTPNDPIYYQYGLSGALNYWLNLANGSEPWPAASTTAAAAAATAAVAPAETTATDSPATDSASGTTPAVDTPASEGTKPATADDEQPAATVVDSTTATTPVESTTTPAAEETAPVASEPESTPTATVEESTTTPTAEETAPVASEPESTPAATEEPSAPSVAETKPADVPAPSESDAQPSKAAPAPSAPKRPVRDAVEKVGKQITSAINGAKAAKAAKAGAAKADSAS